ncbi:hypothetical protein ACQKKX_00230 [Neorhizobium sp. NPDC001467]|uniref:hypothetical protein n=1 Tax=Neorhizobium sp. NPDC001467 TaxID=3390595 RepID=UPI003CFF02B7
MADIAAQDIETRKADVRDRLILALYAQLKAERETREALEYVIRHGALSPEVLEAIANDPVPVVSPDDIAAVERVVTLDAHRRARTKQGRDAT